MTPQVCWLREPAFQQPSISNTVLASLLLNHLPLDSLIFQIRLEIAREASKAVTMGFPPFSAIELTTYSGLTSISTWHAW